MRKIPFYFSAVAISLLPLKNVFAYTYNSLDNDDDINTSQVIEDTIENDDLQRDIKLVNCQRCWYIGGGIGAGTTSSSTTTYDIINNGATPGTAYDIDPYSITNNPWAALFLIDGGYRFAIEPGWPKAISIGLRYRFLLNNNLDGSVPTYSDPAFTYDFTLNQDTNLFTLYTKINIATFGNFSPYISAGVGVDINSVSYSETATGSATARVSPAYNNQTNAGLAAEAGAGVDYYFRRKVVFSLGYDYLYLGASAETGNGNVNWNGANLNFGHESANTVSAQATYLFNG